jgi:hypothetical protein
MIKRFRQITDGLFRGSAPSENDVINLHKYLGVNKIISLDKATGEAIDGICKALHIKHIIIPLNGRKGPLIQLLGYDLYHLLMDGGPTFFHCMEGKDRTGLVAAMFRCLYMGYTYEEALAEAKSLGFGVGVNPFIIGLYTNILKNVCKERDQESIVGNERSYKSDSDGRGSYLDQAHQGSFAPFISKTRQYPYDNPYNSINDQSPTRTNYDHSASPYAEIGTDPENEDIPLIGQYDANGGIRGFGPAEPYGGFIHD